MVRPEPHVPVIVRLLFVIPAERVAAAFRSVLVEEDPREEPPRRLDPRRGRAGSLVRDHQDVKAGFPDRTFVGRRKDLVAVCAVMRQDYPGRAPPAPAHPVDMNRNLLPLGLAIVQDVDFLSNELRNPD